MEDESTRATIRVRDRRSVSLTSDQFFIGYIFAVVKWIDSYLFYDRTTAWISMVFASMGSG